MDDWPLPETAYAYRPLRLTDGRQQGWDVYGLQTGLAGIPGFDNLKADGIFGPETAAAVLLFQKNRKLMADGIAGIGTQAKLSSVLGRKFREGWDLPNGIPYGHIEKESGCLFGNHPPRYPNGSYDCGLVQRNTAYATKVSAFDAPASLMVLCEKIRTNWQKYRELGNDTDRALELACGSWNAPAWTDRLAHGDTLSPAAHEWIEAYIDRVTSATSTGVRSMSRKDDRIKKRIAEASRKLLLVDRDKFRVRLYERDADEVAFTQVAEYPISVGAEGFQTPRGAYVINSKVKDPDWMVPDSAWAIQAGLTPGTIIEGGTAQNPLKERWLGVTEPSEGIGIHGTASAESIGTAASHGCVRMKPKDVIELFEIVPAGTPVVIV